MSVTVTSYGNIIDQRVVSNRQQEQVARLWSYNAMIGLDGIISAYQAGCRNQYEIAQHLGVTEEYLVEAIGKYRSVYGEMVRIGKYTIIFVPKLAILKLI